MTPYDDIVAVPAATTGTVQTLASMPFCRGIRFTTAGTFIGLTKRGNSRTVTGAIGEVIEVAFQSKTGGTADTELLI